MNRLYKYLGITFGFSWFFWGLRILAQQGYLPNIIELFGNLGVFGPFIGYIIITKQDGKKVWDEIKRVFHIKTPKQILWFSIISPFILSGVAYLLVYLVEQPPFELGLSFAMLVPVALIILLTGGPLEEFGWRGFMHPTLRNKYGFLVTTLLVGLIHGVWHLPLHFTIGSVQEVIPIWEYLVITILGAVSYSFIYEYTKSIQPMILLHWLANFSSAVFIYWQFSFGRYMLFILTVLLDIGLIVFFYKSQKSRYQQGQDIY